LLKIRFRKKESSKQRSGRNVDELALLRMKRWDFIFLFKLRAKVILSPYISKTFFLPLS